MTPFRRPHVGSGGGGGGRDPTLMLYAVALALTYLLWLVNTRMSFSSSSRGGGDGQGWMGSEQQHGGSMKDMLLDRRNTVAGGGTSANAARTNSEQLDHVVGIFQDLAKKRTPPPNEATTSPSTSNTLLLPDALTPPQHCPSNTIPAWPEQLFSSPPFLTFGIPTIAGNPPRPYLKDTLIPLAAQLPTDPTLRSSIVKIVVVHNTRPGSTHHELFHQERVARQQDPAFDFIEVQNVLPVVPGEMLGNANFPGARVRQQTRDLANTLRVIYEKHHPQYHVIMEDDFALCPQGMRVITYLIHRATFILHDWLSIRISYGFNGIILPGKDMVPLAEYLIKHQSRRPPDHLLVEWFAGEHAESAAYKGKRPHVCYKYNILDHLGVRSTLRAATASKTPVCYQAFTTYDLFEVEVFKPECNMMNPDEDIWPCPTTPFSFRCPALGQEILKWNGPARVG